MRVVCCRTEGTEHLQGRKKEGRKEGSALARYHFAYGMRSITTARSLGGPVFCLASKAPEKSAKLPGSKRGVRGRWDRTLVTSSTYHGGQRRRVECVCVCFLGG